MTNLPGGIPVRGSGGAPGSSALGMVGRSIGTVASRLISIRAATVTGDFSPASKVPVAFDGAGDVSVMCRSLAGTFPSGSRVSVLCFPPSGQVILGAIATGRYEGAHGDLDPTPYFQRLRLLSTADVELAGTQGHAFQIGSVFNENLAMDTNEIEARDGGLPSTLYLNSDGGEVELFKNDPGFIWNLIVNGGISSPGCMRPKHDFVLGSLTTTSTSYVVNPTGGAGPAVIAIPSPPSGTLQITITGRLSNTAAQRTVLSARVEESGGGIVYSSESDSRSAINDGTGTVTVSRTYLVTGVTSSVGVDVTTYFKVTGGTGTFRELELVVTPCL